MSICLTCTQPGSGKYRPDCGVHVYMFCRLVVFPNLWMTRRIMERVKRFGLLPIKLVFSSTSRSLRLSTTADWLSVIYERSFEACELDQSKCWHNLWKSLCFAQAAAQRPFFDLRTYTLARPPGSDCTDIHSSHPHVSIAKPKSNPKKLPRENLFNFFWCDISCASFYTAHTSAFNRNWQHLKIRSMSDSEDFSGDEEGKVKFQPTLRWQLATFW